jgi:hypothetical protein
MAAILAKSKTQNNENMVLLTPEYVSADAEIIFPTARDTSACGSGLEQAYVLMACCVNGPMAKESMVIKHARVGRVLVMVRLSEHKYGHKNWLC